MIHTYVDPDLDPVPDPDNGGDAEHLIANSDMEDFRAKKSCRFF